MKSLFKTFGVRAFALAAGVASCLAAPATMAADPVTTVRIADFLPSQHVFYTCSMEKWLGEVDRTAKERIRVNYLGGGKVVGATEILDGVRRGVADMGVLVVDYWPDRLNLASFSSLPYVFPDPKKGTEILHELMKGEMGENFRKEGIEPVMILLTTPRQVALARDRVKSLDDLKGLKLRALGWEARTLEALGATTISVAIAEVATSQRTGIIDGSSQTYYAMPGWGLMDATKQAIELRGYTHTLVVLGASTQKWNSWPQAVRDTMKTVSRSIESSWVDCQAERDEQIVAQFKKQGVSIYRISDRELDTERQMVKPVFDKWLAAVGPNGRKVLDQYNALMK